MARQAWCPRCDEVRQVRPGRPCPVCATRLLAVPSASGPRRPVAPRLDLRARAGDARGQLLPAARAALAGLVAVVLVAGAFLAGRVTRSSATTTAPTVAAATSTTRDSDDRRGLNGQIYNWSSRDVGGIGLTLNSISAGDNSTTLRLEAEGVPDGRSIATVQGLSVTDSGGHQLLGREPIREAPARGSPFGGNELALVTVEEPLADKAAVRQVQVDAVTFSNQVEEHLAVTVVDPRLGKQPPTTVGACPTCKLEVRCDCSTISLAGATYQQGAVVLLLAPKGPIDRSVLGGSEPSLLVTEAEFNSETQPAVDREEGGVTAVRFVMDDLTLGSNEQRLQLQVIVANELAQTVKGPWRMRPR
ncbi:MAG TPA: hypothetical protein VNK73_08265 [Actinomycetota bacterium]|nr:hypothetical protein [Actinomycetota bacterium]